jgi:thiol-disulfide isomerase/thioredoxin
MRFAGFFLTIILLAATPAAVALEVGKPAPDFEIASADGKVFKSSEASGEVVVINFWATWCSYCRAEMPALETYYRRHKAEGLRMIAVNMDAAGADAQASEIMRSYSYSAGIGRLSHLHGFGRIWRLPMTFVVDRNGILRRDGSVGEPGIDLATLEREVTPLLTSGVAERRP